MIFLSTTTDRTPQLSAIRKSASAPLVHAILLAAGTGNRFGGQKQIELFRGRPLFAWTLDILDSLADTLVVVGPLSLTRALEHWNGVRHVRGGSTRVESIVAGLEESLDSERTNDYDVVLLADANRPLNLPAVYRQCIEMALEFGVACPSVDLVDGVGVLSADRAFIQGIPDKSRSVAIQTPEAIRVRELKTVIHMFNRPLPPLGVAEASLQAGLRVATFPNSQRGYKVTFSQDLDVLEVIDATAPRPLEFLPPQ